MQKMKISKSDAIKNFFAPPVVKNTELSELARSDREAYDWLAQEAAQQLGVELELK
jgi:hypothetical protein